MFNKEAQTNDTCIGLKYAENLKCCSIQDITPDCLRFKPEIQEKNYKCECTNGIKWKQQKSANTKNWYMMLKGIEILDGLSPNKTHFDKK